MATPKQLVQAVAEILAISEATVMVHDRNLATATPTALRSVAGRGRAAARMTARDAATLLIAVVASSNVKDSAKAVADYGGLVADPRYESTIKRYDDLPLDHTFRDALTALIEAAAADEIGQGFGLAITLRGPRPFAKIEWTYQGNTSDTYYEPPSPPWSRDRPPVVETFKIGDMTRTVKFTENTILYLGAAIGDRL
jgi:hypothetical protein